MIKLSLKKINYLMAITLVVVSIVNPTLNCQAQSSTVSTPPKENILVRGSKDVWHGICWGPKKLWDGTKWVGRKITGKSAPASANN